MNARNHPDWHFWCCALLIEGTGPGSESWSLSGAPARQGFLLCLGDQLVMWPCKPYEAIAKALESGPCSVFEGTNPRGDIVLTSKTDPEARKGWVPVDIAVTGDPCFGAVSGPGVFCYYQL